MRLLRKLITTKPVPDLQSRDTMTLNAFFDDHFYPHIAIRKKRPQHDVMTYDKHIRQQIGNHRLCDLENAVLDWWVREHIRKDYERSTINKHIYLLNRMLNLARHWQFIADGGKNKLIVKRLPVLKYKQRFLSEAELTDLLRACAADQHPYLYLFVKLLALTGARKGEARLARWRDVDFVKREWTVPVSKNGKARRILLSPAAIEVVHAVKAQADRLMLSSKSSDYLFLNPKTRQHYDSFYAAFYRARERADLQDVRIHDLRHTFASLLINRGASIYEVQHLLGHHHVSITERYAHLLPSTLHSRLEVVSNAVMD